MTPNQARRSSSTNINNINNPPAAASNGNVNIASFLNNSATSIAQISSSFINNNLQATYKAEKEDDMGQ
jgi:hypothetical protein